MKELALLLASVMTNEMIVEELEKGITAYKADPTKDSWAKLAMTCSLAMMKEATEPRGDESKAERLTKVMNDVDKLDRGAKLMGVTDEITS